jgi:Arc/MetJ-type ribon-helix-helix transcriptional regulator
VTNAAKIREIVDELDSLRKTGALADESQSAAISAAVVKLEESLARYAESEKALIALIVTGKDSK